ncbi:baculoviral IAP repeat-containing protein 5-like [Frankliniella occidentalis]|uniref:Baculoviral IAP repeat-containing protein 5-like n=1 Tax=Frankliniella occidentalis TaxID=133901 RepID=A0A6J1SEM5_FRAOC|nr:baculoviral IAP repeat-containing protein 5-like [Frankliniella occidentalis]
MDVPVWSTSQEERLKSFKYWPYKRGPCRPEKMAEAGFYSIGSKSEPDLAKCYVCLKELDGWEKDDDPWSEHKKHAALCPYVVLNKSPDQLTVKDILTLECEKQKKILVLRHDEKIKMLNEIQKAVRAELDKRNGKENKRKISRAPSKRTSKKE